MFKEIGHFEAFNRLYLGDKNIYCKTETGNYMWINVEVVGSSIVVIRKDCQYYRKLAEATYETALRAYLDGKTVISFCRGERYYNREEGTEQTYTRPKEWVEKGFLLSLPSRLRENENNTYIYFVE